MAKKLIIGSKQRFLPTRLKSLLEYMGGCSICDSESYSTYSVIHTDRNLF